MKTILCVLLALIFGSDAGLAETGPIRVLFPGHPIDAHKGHNSHENYPMLAKATRRDAIYFDCRSR